MNPRQAYLNQLKKINNYHKYQKAKRKGLYLERNSFQGCHGYVHNYLLGARGIGKSVFSLDEVVAMKHKYGYDNVKCYYFRVKEDSVKALLANKAEKSVDAIVQKKWNMEITCKNNVVYDHGKRLFEAYALVTAGKSKGLAIYDATFLKDRPIDKRTGKPIKRFVYIIIDEFLSVKGMEKASVGDPYDQWLTFFESIIRKEGNPYDVYGYDAIKVYYLANSVSDCANWIGRHLNWIPTPGKFGKFKMKRQWAVVYNVENNQAYLDNLKKSIVGRMTDIDEDANYTNEYKSTFDSIKPPKTRLYKVTRLIKFDKMRKNLWFCLYDNKYIRIYQKEVLGKREESITVPMKRHVEKFFDPDLARFIWDMYDNGLLMYTDVRSQSAFISCMQTLKAK